MNQAEADRKMFLVMRNAEVRKLPSKVKEQYVDMMLLYTNAIASPASLKWAEQIQHQLEDNHNITLDHPAVIATLLILNPESF
jgi:hypothetical protein